MCRVLVSIWRFRLASTTRSFVIMAINSCLHFLLKSVVGRGTLKIPIPVLLLGVEQPKIEQLAPGIFQNAELRHHKNHKRKCETPSSDIIFKNDAPSEIWALEYFLTKVK